MKERIFTTKEQGRVLVEAGLPISTASGFRDKYLDQLHSMEDNAGRIGLIEAVTPVVFKIKLNGIDVFKNIFILMLGFEFRKSRMLSKEFSERLIHAAN